MDSRIVRVYLKTKVGGGTNMSLCSPICIHSLKAQWKAKEPDVSRVCHRCYFSNMLSSQTVHAVYGKAKWAHSQHLSWRIVRYSYHAILYTQYVDQQMHTIKYNTLHIIQHNSFISICCSIRVSSSGVYKHKRSQVICIILYIYLMIQRII